MDSNICQNQLVKLCFEKKLQNNERESITFFRKTIAFYLLRLSFRINYPVIPAEGPVIPAKAGISQIENGKSIWEVSAFAEMTVETAKKKYVFDEKAIDSLSKAVDFVSKSVFFLFKNSDFF
jgi:hypothetical protein